MEKKKFNYGIIGAGHIGKYHIQQIQNIPNVNLFGIFDVNQEQCQIVAEEFNTAVSKKAASLSKSAPKLITFISLKLECNCSAPSFFCKLNNLTFFILEISLKYFIENDLPSSFEYELPCQHIPILKLS